VPGLPPAGVAAAGVGADDRRVRVGLAGRKYRCPHCLAELDRPVPVEAVGCGWFWQLNPDWLAERLAKARQYDEDHAIKEVSSCPPTPPG
jgi:hypothetical protein